MKLSPQQIIIDIILLTCVGAAIYLLYLMWSVFPGVNTVSVIAFGGATIAGILLVIWPAYKFRQALFHSKFKQNKNKP